MSREAIIGRARGVSLMMEEVSEDMLNLAVEYVIAESAVFYRSSGYFRGGRDAPCLSSSVEAR